MKQDQDNVWTWEKAKVYKWNNYWWFDDKKGCRIGPYLTKRSAYTALFTYTDWINRDQHEN